MGTRFQPGSCCGCGGGGPTAPCNGHNIPQTLALTDANATISFLYDSVNGWWDGCYTYSPGVTVATVRNFGGSCPTTTNCYVTLGTGDVAVGYRMICNGNGTVTVTQYCGGQYYQLIGGVWNCCGSYGLGWTCGACSAPTYYMQSYLDCTSVFGAVLNSTTSAPSSYSPFAWSATLPSNYGTIDGGTNPVTNPAPGTITITP